MLSFSANGRESWEFLKTTFFKSMLCNKLKEVLDPKLKTISGVWSIPEADLNSALKQVNLTAKDIRFHVVPFEVYRGWGNALDKFGADRECDGMAVVERMAKDTQPFPLLVELKTTFTEKAIKKAFNQIGISALKLHMLLSLCEGYNPSMIPQIIGIVVCAPPNIKLESHMKDVIATSEMAKRPLNHMCELYNSRKIIGALGGFPIQNKAVLSTNLKNINVELHLHLDPTTPNVTWDITRII